MNCELGHNTLFRPSLLETAFCNKFNLQPDFETLVSGKIMGDIFALAVDTLVGIKRGGNVTNMGMFPDGSLLTQNPEFRAAINAYANSMSPTGEPVGSHCNVLLDAELKFTDNAPDWCN